MNKADFQVGESAVVLGAGPFGLLFVCMLKAGGASKIIVSEPKARRAQAAKACGADIVIDPNKENPEERVMAETGGKGADVVIEAVGWLFPLSVKLVRMGGRVILFGLDTTSSPQVSPALIVVNEIKIFGAFMIKYTMPSSIKILEAGLLPVEKIVSHQLPLEKVHEDIKLTRSGEGIKVVLIPNSDL
jgi:(R,R)-butanediol dehydrogenase/meso-butanediol dehydrogenase/diacetyl reductase